MALIKVYSGSNDALSKKSIEPGSIYFTTDTQEIYVDVPNAGRISFSDKVDLEELYSYMVNRLLSDSNATFKGATENTLGRAGLVPPPTDASFIDIFKGATADSDGTPGLVPPPSYQG